MKLALHHPFQAVDWLMVRGSIPLQRRMTIVLFITHREEDFYDPVENSTPGEEESEDDEGDWEIHNWDQDDPQADWEVLAGRVTTKAWSVSSHESRHGPAAGGICA
ncbi:hypothetical protein V8E54_012439 [Elaphomyces granulatus]